MQSKITRILVPTDLSQCSRRAVNFAKMLAERLNAGLHVLHVADDPILIAPTTSEDFRQQYESNTLDAIREQFTSEELTRDGLELAVRHGNAKREILTHAEQRQIDLIVIGTHGRSGWANMLLGSVAEHVLRKANCPVLTVRDAGQATDAIQ